MCKIVSSLWPSTLQIFHSEGHIVLYIVLLPLRQVVNKLEHRAGDVVHGVGVLVVGRRPIRLQTFRNGVRDCRVSILNARDAVSIPPRRLFGRHGSGRFGHYLRVILLAFCWRMVFGKNYLTFTVCYPTCTAQRLLGFHFPLSVFSKY